MGQFNVLLKGENYEVSAKDGDSAVYEVVSDLLSEMGEDSRIVEFADVDGPDGFTQRYEVRAFFPPATLEIFIEPTPQLSKGEQL